jgi:TetR/AcrR family transcriptional regulator, transcriptional repressor for nem operon
MPRVSRAQSEAHHRAIEAAASRLFRTRGVHSVTVAEVMADVGLTHGGFYAHYASKDALASAACETAFTQSALKWQARIEAAATPAEASRAIAEGYLRPANADPATATCPTATLVTDVARAAGAHPIHAAYLAGVNHQVEMLAALGTSGDHRRNRAAACVRLATMMGALLLARATHGEALSVEILESVRAHLAGERVPARRARRSRTKAMLPRRRRASGNGGVR